MPYCSDCGEQLGSEVRFCPNCGAEYHGWQDDTPAEGRPGESDRSTGDGEPRGGQPRGGRGAGTGQDERPAQEPGGPDTGAGTTGGRATEPATGTGSGDAQGGAPGGGTEATTVASEPGSQDSVPATNVEGSMPFEAGAFGHAFGYPKQGDYDPILIGAIIEFVGSFIPFVNFIVRGYGFRLARASARGQVERPDWGDYGGQFVDGLKIIAVGLAFWLLWLLVAGVFGGVSWVISDTLGVAVFGLVMFVASLLFPASLITYAATDTFTAAFSPSQAGGFLTSMSYVKAVVLSSLIMPVYLLVFFISVFTIVGGFVVLAYGTYFFFSFWGYYYREAVAAGSAPPAPAEPVTAG